MNTEYSSLYQYEQLCKILALYDDRCKKSWNEIKKCIKVTKDYYTEKCDISVREFDELSESFGFLPYDINYDIRFITMKRSSKENFMHTKNLILMVFKVINDPKEYAKLPIDHKPDEIPKPIIKSDSQLKIF